MFFVTDIISWIREKFGTVKVLVIEDDQDNRDVIGDYLKISGFEVVGKAKDGKEGVEFFKKTRPDYVLTDITMPEYDGFYAIENIRSMDPTVDIIALTGDIAPESHQKLKDAGALIMIKPFEIKDFIDLCKKQS